MTRFYGIKPADVELMTTREVAEYVRQYEEYQAELKRANS